MATTQNPTKPVSSFLGSPRFFNDFFMAKSAESSPTSVLDTKQLFTSFGGNPFGFKQNPPRKIFQDIKSPPKKFEPENGIALALLQENPNDSISKPKAISRKDLFGSNLKIQIPSYPPSTNGSPEDPCDFGIKTRNLRIPVSTGSGSSRASMDDHDAAGARKGRPDILFPVLNLSEMESSEEYTRVISYGSNPKTTHIYDDCVVVSCCCDVLGSLFRFCHTCKKNLGEDCDIFMYRGDRAFCCEECRCQEMILDEQLCKMIIFLHEC